MRGDTMAQAEEELKLDARLGSTLTTHWTSRPISENRKTASTRKKEAPFWSVHLGIIENNDNF